MDTAVPLIIPSTVENRRDCEPQRHRDKPARAKSVPGASLRDKVVPAAWRPDISANIDAHCRPLKPQKPALGV